MDPLADEEVPRLGFEQDRVENYSDITPLKIGATEKILVYVGPSKDHHFLLPKAKLFTLIPYFQHLYQQNPQTLSISIPYNNPKAFTHLLSWLFQNGDYPLHPAASETNVLTFYRLLCTLRLPLLQDQTMDNYLNSLIYREELPSLRFLERAYQQHRGTGFATMMVHFLRWMVEQKAKLEEGVVVLYTVAQLEMVIERNEGLSEALREAILEYPGEDPRLMHRCEFHHHGIYLRFECPLNKRKRRDNVEEQIRKNGPPSTIISDFAHSFGILGPGHV